MIYVYAPEIESFYIGAVFLTAVYIPDLTILPDYSNFSIVDKSLLDRAQNYIKAVEENDASLTCLDYIIYPHDINNTEYSELCRRKANHAVSRLIYEKKILDKQVILTTRSVPPLKDYRCIYDYHCATKQLLRCISFTKRQWLLDNHYFKLNDGKNPKDQLGRLTYSSGKALLQGYVNRDYFIIDTLRSIPRFLLNELKNLNSGAILDDPLRRTPNWWTLYFGGTLLDSLTEQERQLYDILVDGSADKIKDLPSPREYKCLNNNL